MAEIKDISKLPKTEIKVEGKVKVAKDKVKALSGLSISGIGTGLKDIGDAEIAIQQLASIVASVTDILGLSDNGVIH